MMAGGRAGGGWFGVDSEKKKKKEEMKTWFINITPGLTAPPPLLLHFFLQVANNC